MKRTQYMSFMAMFLAIEVVLVLTPLGYIPIGPLSATTMHIPVIIAGIVLGKKAGAELGFVFGLTSFLNATFRPGVTSFVFTPFFSIGGVSGNWTSLLIAFIPRILLGFVAGLLYEVLSKKQVKDSLCLIITGIVSTFLHTFLVLGGIYIFFGEAYAQTLGVGYNALIGLLLTVVATNSVAEAIVAAIASLLIGKALNSTIKKLHKN